MTALILLLYNMYTEQIPIKNKKTICFHRANVLKVSKSKYNRQQKFKHGITF